jgi:protein-S-isoprenylcysteine O-methyltransferase Ste14
VSDKGNREGIETNEVLEDRINLVSGPEQKHVGGQTMSNLTAASGREALQSTILDRVLSPLTPLFGRVSLLLIMVFIYWGPLNLVNLGLGETWLLLLNTLMSLGFFVQHSGMIRRSFRRWSGQFIGEKYHGVLFTILSSVFLILIVVFWQQSSYTIVSAQDGLRWLMRGVFFLSIFGFHWGARSLGRFDTFGLDLLRHGARHANAVPSRLFVRGPYRWVRHPLYFFCLLMIWSFPDLTADRFVFNCLWTAWIVVGTILEERDLVEQFGDAYETYQKQVPMLVPTSIRPSWEAVT